MVCCNFKIHLTCLSNFSICPCCSQPYQFLPCCACRGAIEVQPELSHCKVWLKYRHNRTEYCGVDMHKCCQKNHFLMYYNRCPICQVPIEQGQPDYENFEAMVKITNFGAKINTTLCYPFCSTTTIKKFVFFCCCVVHWLFEGGVNFIGKPATINHG